MMGTTGKCPYCGLASGHLKNCTRPGAGAEDASEAIKKLISAQQSYAQITLIGDTDTHAADAVIYTTVSRLAHHGCTNIPPTPKIADCAFDYDVEAIGKHKPPPIPDDRKTVASAADIYPGEHEDFYKGVTAWLLGGYSTRRLWGEMKHFKRGYWKARDNSIELFFILKPVDDAIQNRP